MVEIADLDRYLKDGRFNVFGRGDPVYDRFSGAGELVLAANNLDAFYVNIMKRLALNRGADNQRVDPFTTFAGLRRVDKHYRRVGEYGVLFFPDAELGIALEALESEAGGFSPSLFDRAEEYEAGKRQSIGIRKVNIAPVGELLAYEDEGQASAYLRLKRDLLKSLRNRNLTEIDVISGEYELPEGQTTQFAVRRNPSEDYALETVKNWEAQGKKLWSNVVDNVLELYATMSYALENIAKPSYSVESLKPLSVGTGPSGLIVPAGWEMVQIPGMGSVVFQLYGKIPDLVFGDQPDRDPDHLIPMPRLARTRMGKDNNENVVAGMLVQVFDTDGQITDTLDKLVKKALIS